MSAPATKSEALAARAAYIEGVKDTLRARGSQIGQMTEYVIRVSAESLYPVPKTMRPRTVQIKIRGTTYEFKIENGKQFRRIVAQEQSSMSRYGRAWGWVESQWTLADLDKLTSLFINPTEEVEIP